MGLSVIIPSKTASNLIPCVSAIHELDPFVKVTVIDDGVARPGSALPVFANRWIAGIDPFIFARAINQGITASVGDVVLLNDDAILRTPGGFTAMQRVAEEHSEYGIISAATNVVGNLNQLPHGIGLREEPRMVCFVAVFIPRRTIDLVGLLDEEFTGYGFDDDSYCLRVRRAGLKIGIFDGCFVDHSQLKSTFRSGNYPASGFEHNRRVFEEKYGANNYSL